VTIQFKMTVLITVPEVPFVQRPAVYIMANRKKRNPLHRA